MMKQFGPAALGAMPWSAWAVEENARQVFEPATTGNLLQVVLSLLLVLGLILAMAWLVRRMGQWSPGGTGAIRILGAQSLGQRERIVLVQVGEEQLVLGVAPGRVQTLHILQKPVSMETPEQRERGGFAERLNEVLKRGGR